MAEKILNSRIIQKHDIEANWLKATNFKPMAGEVIIYDADQNYSYPRIKIGDGNNFVNDLPFAAKDNMIVNFSENGEAWIADKTYAEILAAHNEGKFLRGQMSDGTILPLLICNEDMAWFGITIAMEGQAMSAIFRVYANNEINFNIAPVNSGIIVNLTQGDEEKWTADKTFSDLYGAAIIGVPIYINALETIVPLTTINSSQAVFNAKIPGEGGGQVTFIIDSNDEIISKFQPGSEEDIVYVTVDDNNTGTYTADMMADQIYTEYAAGKQVLCKTKIGTIPGGILAPFLLSDTYCVFSGVAALPGTRPQLVYVYITNGEVIHSNDFLKVPNPEDLIINGRHYNGNYEVSIDIPTELPNPNSLTINGIEYDGSTAIEFNVLTPNDAMPLSDIDAICGAAIYHEDEVTV